MKTKYYIVKVLIFIGTVFLFTTEIKSQTTFDSLNIKLPKHYFNTVINIDSYRKANQDFTDTNDIISKRLKSYGIKQFNLSFYTPLYTSTKEIKSEGITQNSHLLLTGNYMLLQPLFGGITQHNLVKAGIGVRYIFNTGRKGVWFVDASPFITKDVSYESKGYFRLASTIVYSYNVNERLNWRVGVTKSFMWGNKYYWPFLGLRVGRLDKINLSIQFPRSINFNVPINSKFSLSAYTKPQGGMFNFSNYDSLYYIHNDATFHYTRYELNSGFRFDARLGNNFSFYLSTGISSKNNITFYSQTANSAKPRLPYTNYFYSQTLAPTLFFNAGLTIRFGKTRSFYKERNMYDVIDLNNSITPGDNNNSVGNPQLPIEPKLKKDINLNSVQDLIDYNEF